MAAVALIQDLAWLASHHCPGVAFEDGELFHCGLLFRHAGQCVPFVPGVYLQPSIVHPLDLRPYGQQWRWRCPEGCLTIGFDSEDPTHHMHHDGTDWVLHDVSVVFCFDPCGHEFRISPWLDDDEPDLSGHGETPPTPSSKPL